MVVWALLLKQDCKQDPEMPRVAVLDLSTCTDSSKTTTGIKRSTCNCTPVDAELFSSRPGLRILQAGWHPGDLIRGHKAFQMP